MTETKNRVKTGLWMAACMGGLMLAGPAQAEFRSFKAAKGDNVILAELVSSLGAGKVKIRKDDGAEIAVNISVFSAADQAYIKNWIATSPDAVSYQFVIDLKEVKLDSKKTEDYSDKITIDKVAYEVSIGNRARARVEGMKLQYKVFKENRVSAYGSFLSSPKLMYKEGEVKLPPMDYNKTAKFVTETHVIRRVRTRYSFNNKSNERDRMEGVWLRFYKGETMVHEWRSSNVPVDDWDFNKGGDGEDEDDDAKEVPGFRP
ncbi:MAG: hypothetical protein P8J87_10500 [Verrucomicrobiales bacterium]|nr:hypothetical protein [Verrucomicrobiales bacterium]